MPILGVIASSNYPRVTLAYDSIATTTVGAGGASTITFSSIPSTYKHLQIRYIDRNTRSTPGMGGSVRIKFNSDSTSGNYYAHRLLGEPTSVYSSAYAGSSEGAIVSESMSDSVTSGIFSASIIDILDYADTSKYKTARTLGGGNTNTTSGDEVFLYSSLWQSTSAISTITLTITTYSFTQYSSFALYGIKG
jgi:hypothetical protein